MLSLMGQMHRAMLELLFPHSGTRKAYAMAGIRLREQGEPIPQNSKAVPVATTPATIR